MAIRNMMQMKQAGYEAQLRDDDGFLHFDYKEAPPPPPQAGPPPEGAPPQGGGMMKSHYIPPTMDELMKRNVEDDIHGSRPIPSAMTTTHGTDLRPLRTRGKSQLNLHSRRSGGKSPDRVNRFSGEHHMSQTVQDRRSEKGQGESNVDEKLKNLDRRFGL